MNLFKNTLPAGSMSKAPMPEDPPPPSPTTTHTVSSGDTLGGISRKYYGSSAQWPQIYEANSGVIGKNPNVIRPGQKLLIPKKT